MFVDPVYTGKSLSGLIGEVRSGTVPRDDVAVFLHTGGLPIIFAYHDVLKGTGTNYVLGWAARGTRV